MSEWSNSVDGDVGGDNKIVRNSVLPLVFHWI